MRFAESELRDPISSLIFRAIKDGFESPLYFEIREAGGRGVGCTIYHKHGSVVQSSEIENLEGTHDSLKLEPPLTYTVHDGERKMELVFTPTLVQ